MDEEVEREERELCSKDSTETTGTEWKEKKYRK